ncbi:MAG: sigma-54-dependent Fis family transcriptional regulator [bacterium]|nr:sigma-54-dependent Fis family transcriptional regulator [bacterium]
MANKRNLLVVDDEQTMRDFLSASLGNRFNVRTATSGTTALVELKKQRFDLVLSDVQMPGRGGLELLEDIATQLDYRPLVIMMTAFGSIPQAVEATRRGAVDYLTKPFGLDQLDHAVTRAFEVEQLRSENRTLRTSVSSRQDTHGLLGNNPQMAQLREKIAMIADTRGTVLLQGESGTGKEVVARAIHDSGSRRDGPFIRINCAAIPETLLESELFGYERGAFTGAVSARKGKFELADGGTLLLDEISEMPYAMQAKLLRVLQEREFMRLGAKYATRTDVRIIATTNRILKDEIKARTFREDLYFRLNVIPLRIVPLRLRKDDIPLLASHFCQVFCAENGRPLLPISETAMRCLVSLDWPGNVRQLQNVIERAVILCTSEELDREILGLSEEMDSTEKVRDLGGDLTLRDMERELILRKLRTTRGNRTKAALELGISVRTLRNKLNLYTDLGVEIPG